MAASEHTGIGRAAQVVVALALGIAANSCGEFVRNNPFDPAVPVTLTIQGPDSAFAQFDTLRFTITTDPAYDYDGVEWQIGGFQKVDNNSAYRVFPIEQYNARPAKVTISATIGARTATKTVDLVFRPATFRARICSDSSRAATIDAFEVFLQVCTVAYDAHGGLIGNNADVAPYVLTRRVLDTTVVKAFDNPRGFQSVGNGTTAVVFNYGSLADTVQITVQQVVKSVSFVSPAACGTTAGLVLSVGDKVQLTLGAPARDRTSHVIADPSAALRASADMRWRIGGFYSPLNPPLPVASITSDGLLTALAKGFAGALAESSTDPINGVYALVCNIEVR